MRNTVDYYKYLIKYNKFQTAVLLIDTLALILALKILVDDIASKNFMVFDNFIVMSLIITSIIKFIYDCFLVIQSYKEYINLRYGEVGSLLIDVGNLEISALEKKLGYVKKEIKIAENRVEHIMSSKEINDFLQTNTIKLAIDERKEKILENFIKEKKDDLFPFIQWQYRHSKFYGKGFFNEQKLCLTKDIVNCKKEGHDYEIHVNKGTYFDTFLTNIIAGKEMRSNQDCSLIASTVDFFPKRINGDQEHLKTITASGMNNEIGISTVGITADNYLVLWTQNRLAQSSDGLLVPTGSGSCDWADICEDDFKVTIQNAMQRELWEESGGKWIGKTAGEIGKTKLLGFYRWMNKCGKPEFVGITKLNRDLMGIIANKSEVYNRYEVEVESSECLKQEIEKVLNMPNVSVPLQENLHVILECLEDSVKRAELMGFLGYES